MIIRASIAFGVATCMGAALGATVGVVVGGALTELYRQRNEAVSTARLARLDTNMSYGAGNGVPMPDSVDLTPSSPPDVPPTE